MFIFYLHFEVIKALIFVLVLSQDFRCPKQVMVLISTYTLPLSHKINDFKVSEIICIQSSSRRLYKDS